MKHNYLKLFYLCIFYFTLCSFEGLAQAGTPYDITSLSTKIDLSTTASSPNAVWDVEVFVVLTDVTNGGREQLTSIAFYNPWSIHDMNYSVNITGHTINNLLANTEYSVKFRIVTEDTFTTLDSSFDTNSQTFTTTELTKAYVNINATGSNNGTSWTNAYTSLQSAIDGTQATGEIWVASGTYVPTASPDGVSVDTRDYAFHSDKDLKIYGGFAGTETLLSERVSGNTTILSGDLDNDNDTSDNAYHVLIFDTLTSAFILDGFTITKGNANGTGSIVFSGENYPQNTGGGMESYNSQPALTNVIFNSNNASHTGGGINNRYSSISIENALFSNNTANYGAGVYNSVSSPTIKNATFYNNNSGVQGGGLENFFYSAPILRNVVFANNSGTTKGGAIYNNNNCDIQLYSVTLYNNTTDGTGAGMHNENSSDPTIYNTVFYQNTANGNLDDIYSVGSVSSGGNNASDYTNAPGVITTITTNPFFDTTDLDGVDNIFGTSDDGLKLSINSTGLLDAGNNTYNTEAFDLAGDARVVNSTIDLGAFEEGLTPPVTLSLEEDVVLNTILVYKNTNNQLMIKGLTEDAFLQVYTSLGESIYSQWVKEATDKTILTVPNLSSGIYIIRLSLESSVVTQKIIVK